MTNNTNTSTKNQPKSIAYLAGKADGDIQGYLPNPKSDSDCFMRHTGLQESDRREYAQGFMDAFKATRKFMGY